MHDRMIHPPTPPTHDLAVRQGIEKLPGIASKMLRAPSGVAGEPPAQTMTLVGFTFRNWASLWGIVGDCPEASLGEVVNLRFPGTALK